MTDRVDAAVEGVEPAGFEATGDRAAADAQFGELRARYDAVLAPGQRGEGCVDPTRPTFCISVMSNVGRIGHGPDPDGEIAAPDPGIATELRRFCAAFAVFAIRTRVRLPP
jgi:hypothetical protein